MVGMIYWLHENEYAAMYGPNVAEKEVAVAFDDAGWEYAFEVLLTTVLRVSLLEEFHFIASFMHTIFSGSKLGGEPNRNNESRRSAHHDNFRNEEEQSSKFQSPKERETGNEQDFSCTCNETNAIILLLRIDREPYYRSLLMHIAPNSLTRSSLLVDLFSRPEFQPIRRSSYLQGTAFQ